MIEKEFAKLMAGLASTTHKTFGAAEVEFWYAALADVPDGPLRQAFYRFVSTGDDWPSIAKIRAMADEQSNGQHLTSGDAFERLTLAVRRYGSYQPVEGVASLDPVTRQALTACGGWMWICDMSSENRQVFAGQFDRAYKAIVSREQEHRRTPEAIRPAICNSGTSATNRAKLAGQQRLAELLPTLRSPDDASIRLRISEENAA